MLCDICEWHGSVSTPLSDIHDRLDVSCHVVLLVTFVVTVLGLRVLSPLDLFPSMAFGCKFER